MNRGADRRPIFDGDDDRLRFEDLLGRLGEDGVEVHAYCLMGNHYHLLAHCPDGGLSIGMQRFGSIFTRTSNRRSGRDGPVFRGRFHSVLVESDAQLVQTVRYIHRNVLDISRQATLTRYRWSSHGCYVGTRRTPSWLRTATVLEHLGGAIDRFRSFVEADDPPAGEPDRRRLSPPIEAIEAAVRTAALTRATPSSTVDLHRAVRLATIVVALDHTSIDADVLRRHVGVVDDQNWRVTVHRSRRWLTRTDPDGELLRRVLAILDLDLDVLRAGGQHPGRQAA